MAAPLLQLRCCSELAGRRISLTTCSYRAVVGGKRPPPPVRSLEILHTDVGPNFARIGYCDPPRPKQLPMRRLVGVGFRCAPIVIKSARHMLATRFRAERCRRLATLATLAAESTPSIRWARLLASRGWLPHELHEEPEDTSRLLSLSQKLSFPLTIAHALPWLQLPEGADTLELCILGAREEADERVPMSAWLELCALADAPVARKVKLAMVGPEVAGRARSHGNGELHVVQPAPIRACFDEVAASDPDASMPDAFVLFNPGLHAGKYSWRSTMQAVLATGRPVVLTAYSDQDAASDAEWLAEGLCTRRPAYVTNPWASLQAWGYDGCGTTDARANQYCTVLDGREPTDAFANGERSAPRVAAVPNEQAWLRRSAMRDFFDEGPRVLRDSVRSVVEMWQAPRS